MRDDREKFATAQTEVFGVNFATTDDHKQYTDMFHFNFPLLSDPGLQVCDLFGAKKGKGIARTVVIIDKKGVLKCIKAGMPSDEDLLSIISRFEE